MQDGVRGLTLQGLTQTIITVILVGALVACSKPPETPAAAAPAPAQPTGLESIPMPDPTKYPSLSKMSGWQNPYLVVREDGIGFVDLSNREVHILKVEEIPAELVSLPWSAWPYGRNIMSRWTPTTMTMSSIMWLAASSW